MAGFGVLEAMGHIQKQGELGRERGQQNRLASLSQQAYGAQGADRTALLGQMEGVQPGVGLAYGAKVQEQDDGKAKRYGGAARYLLAAIKSNDPAAMQGAYMATKPAWQELANGQPLPEQYDPQMLPMLHQVIAASEGAGGSGGADDELKSLRVGANGNYWAIRGGQFVDTGTPAAPTNQIVDTGAGGFHGVDKRTLQSTPVQMGGGSQGAPSPQPQGAGNFQVIDVGNGEPPIDPRSVQAAAMNPGQEFADSAGGPVNTATGQMAQMGGQQGGVLTKAPDPYRASADRRAEEANLRAYDAAQRAARGTAPAGYRFTADGGLEPIPGAPKTGAAAKPPTGEERKAAGFLQRMQKSGAELDGLRENGYRPESNLRDYLTAGEGTALNWMASETGQQNRQQQEDWVRAKLRLESGAVIADEEMSREIKTYFPQPGDKPDSIASKARSRERAVEQMRIQAGRALQGQSMASEGAVKRATNPQTGEVLELRNGQWVPAQ